jgi:dTDP-4-amino-4,6-dideoxygalactose transaminase
MLVLMARRATQPIGSKPRGEWIWQQIQGPAHPAAASAVAGTSDYWLCHSGRRALHEALRREPATGVHRRLWVPAFICRGVVPAAAAAGYEVALYDIDDRLQPRIEALNARAGDAVLVAHFFGLAQPLDELHAQLRSRGVTLIEDCAHLLKPGHDGASTGRLGEWSIFSFRKQLPVPSGGMLLGPGVEGRGTGARVSHKLTPRHALLMAERIGPALLGKYYCGFVEWTREKLDPVRGPEGWRAEDEDAIGATTLRALAGLDLDAIADRRCGNYRTLAPMLTGIDGIDVPFPELPAGSIPWVLPIRIHKPEASASSLWAAGVGAFLWPGFEVLAGVDWMQFPGSRGWLESLVCLPIHQDLSVSDLERVRDSCRRVAGHDRSR